MISSFVIVVVGHMSVTIILELVFSAKRSRIFPFIYNVYQTKIVSSNFVLPTVKRNGHNSYKFNGITLWNKQPFQPSDSEDSFKFTSNLSYFVRRNEEIGRQ